MSKFIPELRFEADFDGDHVVATFAQISFEDALIYQESEGFVADAKIFVTLLKKYNRSFQGLTDANGAPLSLEIVCDTAYFGLLIVEMGKFLIKAAHAANPKKPDATSAS
jgi:hypothetical protein